MFPDPFDCQAYHFCTPDKLDAPVLQSTKAKCGDTSVGSYGYNPKTTFCSDKLSDAKCTDFPVPICERMLQKGIISRNPTLYYVCLNHPLLNDTSILYPFQMACPFGKTLSPCGCE
ncbi:hypothetical protein PPYR_13722 [Photinus pyralis]|nr:hypothetical protein PPYR_13722 [Photinus pyralis]